MKFSKYFSSKYIFSKGALWNAVFSDRSDGKTFDIKYNILCDFRDHGYTSVYLRRYKTEIQTDLKETFFNEVINIYPEFSKWQFKHDKNKICVSTDSGKNFKVICYILPLTMTAKLKSVLYVNDIHCIYYDEFVPVDDRYIQNEINILLEFWKSVDRDRDNTRLLICGNKISPFNPLFDYFGIKLSITNDTIKTYKNGSLAVQIYSCREHREKRKKSRFNELVSGSAYDDYNQGGILYALNLNIMTTENANYIYSFKTNTGEGSIWADESGNLIISEKKRKDGFLIVDKIYNTGREEIAFNYSKFPQFFKNKYRLGKIAFDSENAFNLFQDILTKIK